jgi:hypothetical protein
MTPSVSASLARDDSRIETLLLKKAVEKRSEEPFPQAKADPKTGAYP